MSLKKLRIIGRNVNITLFGMTYTTWGVYFTKNTKKIKYSQP